MWNRRGTQKGNSYLKRIESGHVVAVRGKGLMIGVEVSGHGDVIRFLPPYGIEEGHVRQTVHALDEILKALPPAERRSPDGDRAHLGG